MIKNNINLSFSHHLNNLENFDQDIFVADYTEMTRNLRVRKGVEFHSPVQPNDIKCLTVANPNRVIVNGLIFSNLSFVCGNGNSRTQCEGVPFPDNSDVESWILFCELKYSSAPSRNQANLKKAIKQLYKTRYYYYQNSVFTLTNTSYLIASLPPQSEPFSNFSLTPHTIATLKRKRNIVLRLMNSVSIENKKIILV